MSVQLFMSKTEDFVEGANYIENKGGVKMRTFNYFGNKKWSKAFIVTCIYVNKLKCGQIDFTYHVRVFEFDLQKTTLNI